MANDTHAHRSAFVSDILEHVAIDPETGFSLNPEFVDAVILAIEDDNTALLDELVQPLHAADQAELLDRLNHDQRLALTSVLKADFDSEVLPELSAEAAEDVLEALGAKASAQVLSELETDDAVHIIEDLDPEDQELILCEMTADKRDEVEQSLSYPDESAGRLMRRKLVTVPISWSIGQTIDYLREEDDLPENFYIIYATNADFKPVGRILLGAILHSKRDVAINSLCDNPLYAVSTDTDQEEVAFLFRKYALVETPVVNEDGVLVGTITVDDVVDVIKEEEDEDYHRAGGVTSQDISSRLITTVRSRFGWLFINLITAVLASLVIGLFASSIEQVVALAVLMPIVASMGGNAGTQSVTVAVRAIATRYLTENNSRAFIVKEALIGLINGLALGSVMGIGTYVWFADVTLASVMFFAAVGTLTMAGLWGALIPILIHRYRGDPAISSGIFLTTVTDCVGFFSFLGLATLILL